MYLFRTLATVSSPRRNLPPSFGTAIYALKKRIPTYVLTCLCVILPVCIYVLQKLKVNKEGKQYARK
jgi:hypothetical protein